MRVQLPGLYASDFAVPKDRIAIDPAALAMNGEVPLTEVDVQDARMLQADRDPTEFFSEYGFVLLDHATEVSEWNTDPVDVSSTNQVGSIYAREVEQIVRELILPNSGITYIYQPPNVITRGNTEDTEPYALGVHQDYGITADEFEDNLAAFAGFEVAKNWRLAFENSAGGRFVALSLWRTIQMNEPLRHMPLALCDPRSVRQEDLVPTSLVNFTPTGLPSIQMGLKHHPDQRWYYYSNMTTDEVLVINQFDLWRGEVPKLRSCFHTAFELPNMDSNVEPRRSCEYRPQVFF